MKSKNLLLQKLGQIKTYLGGTNSELDKNDC